MHGIFLISYLIIYLLTAKDIGNTIILTEFDGPIGCRAFLERRMSENSLFMLFVVEKRVT